MVTEVVDIKGEKIHISHSERNLHSFKLNETKVDIINTKHSLYRVLEKKNMNVSDLSETILSIGLDEIERHFKNSRNYYHKERDWKKKIDYVVSIYDAVNEIVLMVGFHPHLKRITIVTLIPRVHNVEAGFIHGAYRIDSLETQARNIQARLPQKIKMQYILK